MVRFLAGRVVRYLVLLAVAVSAVYLLAATALDPRSLYELRNPAPDPAAVEAALRAYNLSDAVPLLERYRVWATGVLTGWDWGRSPTGEPVDAEVATRVWVSARLVTLGALLGVGGGVALGAWTATRQHRLPDRLVTLGSLLVLATPTVVLAVGLQLLAVRVNQAAGWPVLEFLGETGRRGDGAAAAVADRLQHLLLPTLTLALGGVAAYSRIQRNLMLDTIDAEYVTTARAKGLPRGAALRRHALRTALVPTGTYLAFTVATVVLGATVVELVYGWHGMGEYAVAVIAGQDVHGAVAVAAFGGACVLTGALLADLATAALDPRVRLR